MLSKDMGRTEALSMRQTEIQTYQQLVIIVQEAIKFMEYLKFLDQKLYD